MATILNQDNQDWDIKPPQDAGVDSNRPYGTKRRYANSPRPQELCAIRLQQPASRFINILFRDQRDVRSADVLDAGAEQVLGRRLNESGGHDHRRAGRRRDVRRAAVIADEQAQPRGCRDEIGYFRRFDGDGASCRQRRRQTLRQTAFAGAGENQDARAEIVSHPRGDRCEPVEGPSRFARPGARMDADEKFAETDIVFSEKSFDPLVRLAQSGDSRLGLDGAHAQRLEPLQVLVRDVSARAARMAYRLRQPIQRGLDASLFAAQPLARMNELQDEARFGAGLELDGQIEMLAAQSPERFRGAIEFARVQELGVPESGDREYFIDACGEPKQIGARGA